MAWEIPPPSQNDPAPWGGALNASLNELESRTTNLEAIPPGSAQEAGVVQLDSFAGSTDDQKLTNALSYAAAQTRVPYIRFPARNVVLSQSGRVPFSGMKLIGPHAAGSKNLEIQSGKPVNHRVTLNMNSTSGATAWFHGSSSLYSIYVGDLAFQSNHTAQFWSQPTGTMYACQFHSLTFFGMRHVFGRPGQQALMTQVSFTGHWQSIVHTGNNVQFTIGGSDNEFWTGGFCNLHGGSGSGNWQMVLNSSKTNIGKVYMTAEGGWRGIRVAGGNGVNFFGVVLEGRNASTPCHGSVIRLDGGSGALWGPWIAYGMSAPSSHPSAPQAQNNGMVHVTGGDWLIDRPYYARANGVAESVPLVYATGSSTRVALRDAARLGTWSGLPRYQSAGGASIVADATYQAA